MNDREVELRLLDMSAVLKPSTAYALVLEEVGGESRKLALIIGVLEAQVIEMARVHYRPPRPFTHDLMLNIMRKSGQTPLKAVIYNVCEGIYFTWFYFTDRGGNEHYVDSRTSDAIALSLRAGFPIYIHEDLLEKEKLCDISDDGSMYMMTINTVDLPTLRTALEEAVKKENYERASELRDEIRRRETDDAMAEEGGKDAG